MSDALSSAYSIAVDRALVEQGDLYDFVRMAWREIEPAAFIPNWHLEEICVHLEALSTVQIRNLVINIPPGCGKSLTMNVLWPVWEWIKRPQTKFIYASFDQSLVGSRDGTKVINLLQSEWFISRWGKLLVETVPSASDFLNTSGGFRFATSPGGKATGRHGNITAVDDPIKPNDVATGGTVEKKALQRVSSWWGNTMSSRQADPNTHRNLITMQRVHMGDLAGEMARAGYEVLKFPMRFVFATPCITLVGGDRRTREGELLFPARYSEESVKALEIAMGPTVAAAQLQQDPKVDGGGIFKREWWRFWHYSPDVRAPCLAPNCFMARRCLEPALHGAELPTCEVLPERGYDVQSWDLTFTDGESSDYVAWEIWRSVLAKYYMLDVDAERLSYVEAKAKFRQISREWPTTYIKLVEKAANGPAMENDLKKDIQGITLCPAKESKELRARACSPLFAAAEAGEPTVFIPHPNLVPKVWDYMAQMEGFPKTVNDDMVDATSQVLNRFRIYGTGFAAAMEKLRNGK